MSRQRNNFITNRDSLPSDIKYITNLSKGNLSEDQTNISNTLENLDKSQINKKVNGNVVFFKKPKFMGTPKEYSNKENQTQLYFHERANLITKIDKKNVGSFEDVEQMIDFEKFIGLFQNENEINNLEIQDLLDTDFEKLSELKAKAEEFTDATSTLLEEKTKMDPNHGESVIPEEELMNFFMEKLNEMKQNELNLRIFIDNLERVKGIAYSNNGVKIYYKKS